jgi:hypothetical protein
MATQREHTVVIMGAGATLAEALFHRPRRDSEHPPLDRNFFERAERRVRSEGPSSQRARLLRRIVARADALGQTNLCGSNPSVSLEEHLGRLFFELNTSATHTNIQCYYDLVRLYNSELLITTNWLVGRNGVMRRLLQGALSEGRVSIITFNHDLLIENALATLPTSRYAGTWCFRHAYGLPNPIETIADPTERFGGDCPGSRDQHVPIFKLHGSCNWVYRTRNEYPSARVARGDRKLMLWENTQLSQATNVQFGGGGGRSRWYMWPHIVPPVYEKHSYITGILKRVWDGATDALDEATRVVFWGYSFPRADLHARYFFSGAAHRNQALRQPVLINPDPRSQDELWQVLQPEYVTHYRHIAAYLAHRT